MLACKQFEKDITIFDHAKIRDAKLFLNSHQIPYEALDLDFTKDQYSHMNRMFSLFRRSYLEEGRSYIGTTRFKNVCPLLAFGATKMPADIKSSPVDVCLELTLNDNMAASTCAHALLIYDEVVTYSPFSGLVLRQVQQYFCK